jgi:aminoglycoside 2'-N-acetyltransferase I
MQRVAAGIGSYELGALSPARQSIYKRLGWDTWQGPLSIRTDDGLLATPGDEVMALRLAQTPRLDVTQPLTAEWREGELW